MAAANSAPGLSVVVEAINDPVTAAQIGYAQDAWKTSTISGVAFPTVLAAVSNGREVTVLAFQDNPIDQTSSLVAITGILRVTQGRRVLDVGDGAYDITPDLFRDLVIGRNGAGAFAQHYATLISELPELEPLTADHLLDLPGAQADPTDEEQLAQRIGLTIFGNRRMPGPTAYGSLFFVTEHNDGILEGFLYVMPGGDWESEHGSTYVRDVLSQHGLVRVKNQDPKLLFATAMGVLGHGNGFYNMAPAEVFRAIQG